MNASILAIGTEITQGQIINSNASYISGKLSSLGLQTIHHLAVPDDRKLIFEALEYIAKYSEIIFVTGGLGPTTDDFTREVVAQWSGLKLVYNEATFQYIKERLDSRGVPVRENQKQQCYFPENSKILFNSTGTAHGFFCNKQKIKVFVLPGPPKEVETVWEEIEKILPEYLLEIDPQITKSFDCLGLGESEIAHLTEEALKDKKILLGYRVHHPYTEVKLISFKSQEKTLMAAVQILEDKLKSYIVTKDGRDLLEDVSEKLSNYKSFSITDEANLGFLVKRFQKYFEKFYDQQEIHFSKKISPNFKAQLQVSITEPNDKIIIDVYDGIKTLKEEFFYPASILKYKDRRGFYATEMALITLKKFFS